MQYVRLGTSGLQISRLALGCMSFGKPGTGRAWALDGDAADPIFRKAAELGATFWESLFDFLYFLPVIGDAFGKAAAAFSGSTADVGIEDSFIASVREKVKPGTSALFAVTSDAVLDRVVTAMSDAGLRAEMIKTSLSDEQEEALRDAFAED